MPALEELARTTEPGTADLGAFLSRMEGRPGPVPALEELAGTTEPGTADLGAFLSRMEAAPALCRLLRNSPAQRSLGRRTSARFFPVWRVAPALYGFEELAGTTEPGTAGLSAFLSCMEGRPGPVPAFEEQPAKRSLLAATSELFLSGIEARDRPVGGLASRGPFLK
ncbi:MAG TPA: hypothetical protein VGG72_24765 [Bryobacteraceae bacterium]